MKNTFLSSSRYQLVARGLLAGCACLLLASASAQTLKNGNFEAPLDPWDPTGQTGGKTNWTVVYPSGGPGSFAMKDRSTESSRHGANEHGAHLRPRTEMWCHAYFTQTVTNLNANASYVVSGEVNISKVQGNLHVYIETLGGAAGTTSIVSPDADATGWHTVFVTNTASATGKLEVRLHLSKQDVGLKLPGVALYPLFDARFDDITLTAQ